MGDAVGILWCGAEGSPPMTTPKGVSYADRVYEVEWSVCIGF